MTDLNLNAGLVVYRLDELKREIGAVRKEQEAAREEMAQLREEVAGLKVKSGIWGAIAGAIPAGLAFIWWTVRGGH